ncbi:hypothetical protein RN001_002214 [Aquatica leii]|uniref:26S proteasome non-ATPase regulatory subunit 9 n=1 Tax=Aquatica leii TaxID=1421715 RepID=A0AAN7SR57_9COLE|nr:hypothetical protein RN001_002214 [Aquatica leii]
MEETGQIREHVLALMKRKDTIEKDIKELTEVLTQNGVGMDEPLVDAEGFPINSIDIYQVRHARHRIICLQNDHKSIMKQIEEGLQGYYSSSSQTSMITNTDPQTHDINIVMYKIPYAKVTIVTPGSPADNSGIQVEDLIVEFGSVNHTNFQSINDIAIVVQHSEGQQLNVKLKRGERYIGTTLIPKKWAGKGLLGCNVVPYNV